LDAEEQSEPLVENGHAQRHRPIHDQRDTSVAMARSVMEGDGGFGI